MAVLPWSVPSCIAANALQPTPVVLLSWFPKSTFDARLGGLQEQLSGHGLKAGVDFEFHFRHVQSEAEVHAAIREREGGRMVLVSLNTSPARYVFSSGTRAPHVFLTYSDPVQEGWIQRYARPEGTATGVVQYAPVHGKRLDLLRRLVPNASRIAVMVEAESLEKSLADSIAAFEKDHPGTTFAFVRVSRGDDPGAVAQKLRSARVEAAFVPLVGKIDSVVEVIYLALGRARVPAISERGQDVRLGAVLSLQVDQRDVLANFAHQIALVLKGTPPGSIPIQSPRKFRLTVNLDAARTLGIDVPRSLLRQADVIVGQE